MEWDTEIPIFTDIRMHGSLRHIDTIILRCVCEVVCSIEKWEFALGHPHLFTDIIDTIRECDSMDIIYVLGGEVHHTTRDISRIFSTCKHTTDPIYGSITIRVTQGLMHRRDKCMVLLTILIIHERLTSCFEDIFSCEFSGSMEDTSRLEEIERITEITSSELRYELKCSLFRSF
jgi:hypothetical protein